MGAIPNEIPGIGSTNQRLRPSPGFDPLKAQLSTEDYFVWSRFDGATTIRELVLMTGLDPDRVVTIIRKLRELNAILLPTEESPAPSGRSSRVSSRPPVSRTTSAPMPPVSRTTSAPMPPVSRTTSASVPPVSRTTSASVPAPGRAVDAPDPSLPNTTVAELAALADDNELSDADRRRILAMLRWVKMAAPHAILGVAADADRATAKKAYFRLSKEFHPDRFYGKRTGQFRDHLAAVFDGIASAFQVMTEGRAKRTTDGKNTAPQTPQEHAADLFARACDTEVKGDLAGALKLFDAALRVDAPLKYLRRAASCALADKNGQVAEEYAKKAYSLDAADPSLARLLAQAFRCNDKLVEAEELLAMAMALKNENDVLAAELRRDLADVRRLLGSSGR